MKENEYSIQELMVASIAREIKNGETVGVGALSPIPAAAVWLARELHAPNLTAAIFASSEWPFQEGGKEFFDLAQRGDCDLFFLSGAQIDQKANINLHFIGDSSRPKVRLPGGAGAAMMYYMAGRVILFINNHTPQVLVDKVDFVTAGAGKQPGIFRRGTAHKLVTPMCIMNYNTEREKLEPASLHPGISLEELQANTGFPLGGGEYPETTEPNADELLALRTTVKEKMLSLYPLFAKSCLGNPPGD